MGRREIKFELESGPRGFGPCGSRWGLGSLQGERGNRGEHVTVISGRQVEWEGEGWNWDL